MSCSAANSSQSRGSYYFCIEGLPERYTWQDLKDLIRQEASHGIWTEMAMFPNGQTGQTGFARVQRRDEALNLFRYLESCVVEGRRLMLHLFDTSDKTAARKLVCTCREDCVIAQRQRAAGRNAAVCRVAASPSCWTAVAPPTQNRSGQTYAVQPPSYVPTTIAPPASAPSAYSPPTGPARMDTPQSQSLDLEGKMANMHLASVEALQTQYHQAVAIARAREAQLQAQAQTSVQAQAQALAYAQARARSQSQATAPSYMSTPNGIMVNTDQGVVRTETRGIFVSRLDFGLRSNDVKRYFGQAGEIVKCELQKDASTGKSKGIATIQYDTAKHASMAVDMFNGQKLKGMRLDVRLDKEAIAVGAPTTNGKGRASDSKPRATQQKKQDDNPIIANGSVCQK